MGKASRDKGKRGEREAAEVLRPLFPNVRRRAMQSRGGSEGADLDNTPGLHVEVGIGRVNPRTKWEQAERDALASGAHPQPSAVAMTRADRGPWLVTITADLFMEMVRCTGVGLAAQIVAQTSANSKTEV